MESSNNGFPTMILDNKVEKSLPWLRGSYVATACSVVSLSLKAPQKQNVTMFSVVHVHGYHGLLTVNRSEMCK